MTRRWLLAGLAALAIDCGPSASSPATLDTAHEPCGFCRMIISDQRFASQIVAPRQEPKFFDDLGCLTRYLTSSPAPPKGAVVFVADHRTKAWVPADRAVYTRVDTLSAPMGSHIVAHETAASRDADAEAAQGVPMAIADVFPGDRLPGGSR